MSRNARRDDKTPYPIPLLPFENLTHELCAIDNTVQIHPVQIPNLLQPHLQQPLAVRLARIRHKNIDPPKRPHRLLHAPPHALRVRDVHPESPRVDAVRPGQRRGERRSGVVAVVPQREVAAGFGVGGGDGAAYAARGAGHDADAVPEAELFEHVGGDGGGWVRGPWGFAVGQGHGHFDGMVGDVPVVLWGFTRGEGWIWNECIWLFEGVVEEVCEQEVLYMFGLIVDAGDSGAVGK